MKKLPSLFVSLLVLTGCSNGPDTSNAKGINMDELPDSCSTFSEDMAFVNPFVTPIEGLYDFNQVRTDMIGADEDSITNCAKKLAATVVNALSETEFESKQVADIVFYSLRTEDEYEADDISALYFQFRISFKRDSGAKIWSQINLKNTLDKGIWKDAK